MRPILFGIVLLWIVLTVPCYAGNELSVRLVEAVQGADEQSSAGLEDVIGILKRSLASANYRLVDSCIIQLPASAEQTLGSYTIKCSGTQKNLAVTVLRHGKEVLKTANIPLQGTKPFILGGLPGKSGVMLLVFLVK